MEDSFFNFQLRLASTPMPTCAVASQFCPCSSSLPPDASRSSSDFSCNFHSGKKNNKITFIKISFIRIKSNVVNFHRTYQIFCRFVSSSSRKNFRTKGPRLLALGTVEHSHQILDVRGRQSQRFDLWQFRVSRHVWYAIAQIGKGIVDALCPATLLLVGGVSPLRPNWQRAIFTQPAQTMYVTAQVLVLCQLKIFIRIC